jgi:hypothetical protein
MLVSLALEGQISSTHYSKQGTQIVCHEKMAEGVQPSEYR